MNPPFRPRVGMLSTLAASCIALSACGGGDAASLDGSEQPLGKRAGSRDNTPPVISVNPQTPVDSTGVVGFSGSATDNYRVQMVTWSSDAGGSGTAVLSGTSTSATWAASQVQLKEGDNTVTFVAQDSAGNKSSTTKVVTYAAPAPAPAPTPSPDPTPVTQVEASLSTLPVTVDLLARTGPTATCAEGYLPGPEASAAAIPLSAPALTYTPTEVATWRARTASGPFVMSGDYATNSPGDWSRITTSAKAFLSSGETTITTLADDSSRTTHGTKARDAAFVYLLTGDTAYLKPVRDYLIAQTANPANDFTKLCIRNLDRSVRDAWFGESAWLLRQIVTYDYVRQALPLVDRQTIEDWIRRNAYFFAVQIDRGNASIFPNRLKGDYSKRTGPAAAVADADKWVAKQVDTNGDCKVDTADSASSYRLALYARADGSAAPNISVLSQFFNNRKSVNATAFGAAGALLGDTELINRSKRYFLEWLTYAVWPDGAEGEYTRNGDYCIPRQGTIYGTMNSQGAVLFGDWMARRGDTTLFTFSTRDGLFGTESGLNGNAKSIGLAVSTYLNLLSGKLAWYQYEPQKTVQQPRSATSLGAMEVMYMGSAKPMDDYHDLGYLIGAGHLPSTINAAGVVMRDPRVTTLRFPGSTGNPVATGYGSAVSAWTDAFGALPSAFLLRP